MAAASRLTRPSIQTSTAPHASATLICSPVFTRLARDRCFHRVAIASRLYYGFVTAFISSVTAVCAYMRPVSVAPAFIAINVLDRITPLNFAPVPI